MQQQKQNKVSIFIYHSGIYFYAFIFIIIGMIVNEVSSETNLHKLIKTSKQYQVANQYKVNSLVHLTNIITSKGTVGDDEYIFNQKDIIILKKTVEMYQWEFRSRGRNPRYEKSWENRYINDNDKLHKNPIKTRSLGTFYFYPESVNIGTVPLPIQNFKSDSYIQFQLKDSVKDERNRQYIFLGAGTINSPIIGDIRIRYQGYESNQISTLFAIVSNNKLLFKDDKNYTSFYGTNLFQTLYKGNVDSVIASYIKDENSFKDFFNSILSFILFITILKFSIVISNVIMPEGIKSNIKKYVILFLVILPISMIGTSLVTKVVLLGVRYF